jgi:hypothetical protein
MVVRPVGVHFGWVREVAVFVDQLEHELLRADLQGVGFFARGEQHGELCQLGDGRMFKDGVDR